METGLVSADRSRCLESELQPEIEMTIIRTVTIGSGVCECMEDSTWKRRNLVRRIHYWLSMGKAI
jgi:hypothetical protein